ncbi:MAG: energy transducer TonB [Prevotella sp.]|nr:energy transducer TonB [Prevotella sp.]
MEIKKSDRANLENRRLEGFLLGLVFALALLFTGLEYTSRPDQTEDNSEMLDDMSEEMDLMPAMDTKDMISAVPAPASKSITTKIKEVEKTSDNTQDIAPVTSKLLIGDGEGVAKDANVTEALPQIPVEQDDNVLRTVEQLPEFPGGMVEFMKWLTRNLHYPNLALQQKIEGKVVVSFIVNTDGTIANPKVEKSANPLLDNEALRVIRMMPRWKPGIMDEKPCRTMFAIPVNFKI